VGFYNVRRLSKISLQELPTLVYKLLKKEVVYTLNNKAVQMVQDEDITSQPDSLQNDQTTQQTYMSDTPMVHKHILYMLFYYHSQVQEMDDDVEGRSAQDQLSPINMADILKHVSLTLQ